MGHSPTRPRRLAGPLGLATAALIVLTVLAPIAFADPPKQAPWRPDAAAYRNTLFLAELEPVPWDAIAAAWTEPGAGAAFDRPAFALIESRAAGAGAAGLFQP